MAKIQTELPEPIHTQLKIHKARYNFVTLGDALVDVAKRFFSGFDEEYFVKKNDELAQRDDDPPYLGALEGSDKSDKKNKRAV